MSPLRIARALSLTAFCSTTALAQATLSGIVREDSTLRTIRDVEVAIPSLARSTRTDGSGRFALRELPLGAHQLVVRRLGYEHLETTVELVAGSQERVFYLKLSPKELDTVTVPARRPRGLGREAFEDRRKFGLGKFIDSVELKKNEHRKAIDLVRGLGVRIVPPPTCTAGELKTQPSLGGGRFYVERNPPYCDSNRSKRIAVSASHAYDCPMMVVLDGVIVYRPAQPGGIAAAQTGNVNLVEWERTFDLNALMVSSLESVEIYRRSAEIPIEFGGSSSSCGVLVLWQRR